MATPGRWLRGSATIRRQTIRVENFRRTRALGAPASSKLCVLRGDMPSQNHTTPLVEDSMDWRAVDHRLRALARRRASLDAEEAGWLREAERMCIWRELGHATMLAYMEHTLGYGPRAALERLRVARALEVLPAVAQALSSGALSYSAARELTRAAAPSTEEQWLSAARNKNLRAIEELVSGHAPGDLPGDLKRPELGPRRVQFNVSPETFALLRQTRTALEDECGHSLDEDQLLSALCRRALEGASSSESARALHQIAITLCDACGRGWQDGAGAVVLLDERAVEQAQCDAEHVGPLEADKPARASQDISPAIRRLVWRRDHARCKVPGCRSARNLDIHHVVMRAEGGTHEPANLILCCSSHHAAVHRGLLRITGSAPDGLVFAHCEVAPRNDVVLDELAEKLGPPTAAKPSVIDLVLGALVRLGFRSSQARAMVRDAYTHVGESTPEVLLREALRRSSP